jgi:hypothetical protein
MSDVKEAAHEHCQRYGDAMGWASAPGREAVYRDGFEDGAAWQLKHVIAFLETAPTSLHHGTGWAALLESRFAATVNSEGVGAGRGSVSKAEPAGSDSLHPRQSATDSVPCSFCGKPMEDRGAEKQWCAECVKSGKADGVSEK